MRGISLLAQNLRDLWLPPRSRCDLLPSRILRSVWWLNLDDGTDRLSRNVGKEFPPTVHCVISQKSVDLIAAENLLASPEGLGSGSLTYRHIVLGFGVFIWTVNNSSDFEL